jgi:catalase
MAVDDRGRSTGASEERGEHPGGLRHRGDVLTTDQGVPIPHTDDSLRIGARGPTLLEDFHFREKLTRFDHERIPERVVHARGSGAHGWFEPYASAAALTKARFLSDPSVRTPVFVRFSTVAGSRGSADTVRDVRGFAVKFYTQEGNFDLVGNNIPVFFIQDGIKFPDVVHAAKPEPDHEMPQAATAHDAFWDFVGLQTETLHMIMWTMSDRAIPRSLRMMEGFGVHTFRLVDAQGGSRFVKFHWKPKLGVHGLVWDEAQKLAGKDPDFHRRDLWEAIERGEHPEWELGVQVIEEADVGKLAFDLLDPTKIVPEEQVPVLPIGRMVLDRNPRNFFAETEQVAFCVSNLVPGIDVTDDPLMQARLFSYLDTQLTRLGGPNFAQIPINRPIAPVNNHQQDGFHQHVVPDSRVNYHPSSIPAVGCPHLASGTAGYTHFPEPAQGRKVRERSATFGDHFTQAALFFRSLTPPEQQHLVDALIFELGKCRTPAVRERVVGLLGRIDDALCAAVAVGLGLPVPSGITPVGPVDVSPALRMVPIPGTGIRTRQVAVLVADGVDAAALDPLVSELVDVHGAWVQRVAPRPGEVTDVAGKKGIVDKGLPHAASVEFDAVLVGGGEAGVAALAKDARALHFVREAYKHHKPIGAVGDGVDLLAAAGIDPGAPGVVTAAKGKGAFVKAFVAAIERHRHWDRLDADTMPA